MVSKGVQRGQVVNWGEPQKQVDTRDELLLGGFFIAHTGGLLANEDLFKWETLRGFPTDVEGGHRRPYLIGPECILHLVQRALLRGI